MPGLPSTLIAIHVLGDIVWIGSILAVSLILSQTTIEPKLRGEIGLKIYRRLTNPAFIVALVFGLIQLLMNAQHYFVATKYMHGKLTFALLAIGLTHMIGGRAKRMALGTVSDAGKAPLFGFILLGFTALITVFAILKPF